MSNGAILPAVADAVRRYASYLRSDGRRRRGIHRAMSPMDENTWFETPKTTAVTILGTSTQIVLANPMRVALILQCNNGPFQVSTDPNLTTTTGFNLVTTVLPWAILQEQTGPLCTLAWFGITPVPPNQCIVVEVILRDWPN